jgi:hypothetical protein
MEYSYIDDAIRTVRFDYNGSSNDVIIEVPHFWDYAGMQKIIFKNLKKVK